MTQRFIQNATGAAALLLLAATSYAAAVTEITLPGTRIFPESITSTKNGTLIVASLGHGNISRIAKGSTNTEEWIKPGTGGLNNVLGVFADEKGKTLWVCSNNMENKGEATALMAFDLKTGAAKGTFPLPGGGPLCNDIAVADDGTAYITDTRQASLLMLKPGAKALEVVSKDPLLAGADGLAFANKTTLYVNSVTANKLLRVDIGADGKGKKVTDLKLSRAIERPDGFRSIGKGRFLMAENSGKMTIVTFDGDSANITTIKEGLVMTPAVTATRGMAWIIEGKLPYRNDAAYKDKDPGAFKLYAVPLPKK